MMGPRATLMIHAPRRMLAIAAALVNAGLSPPIAYLITGGVAGILALALIGIGVNRLSGDALKPALTLHSSRGA